MKGTQEGMDMEERETVPNQDRLHTPKKEILAHLLDLLALWIFSRFPPLQNLHPLLREPTFPALPSPTLPPFATFNLR